MYDCPYSLKSYFFILLRAHAAVGLKAKLGMDKSLFGNWMNTEIPDSALKWFRVFTCFLMQSFIHSFSKFLLQVCYVGKTAHMGCEFWWDIL